MTTKTKTITKTVFLEHELPLMTHELSRMEIKSKIRRVWQMSLPKGWRLYVSNCPMKARTPRTANDQRTRHRRDRAQQHKASIYEEHHGQCEMCHRQMKQRQLQLHHLLPMERYPELAGRRDNLMLLCPKCHDEVHKNPFLNSRLMVAAACRMKIDLTERFER